MNARAHIAGALLAGLLGQAAMAQESALRPGRDAELRIGAGVDYRPFSKPVAPLLNRNLRVLGELEWRADENATRTKMVNLSGAARYKVSDLLRLGAEYRHSFRGPDRRNVGRTELNARLSTSHGRTDLKYTVSFQRYSTPLKLDRNLLRNKLAVEHDFRKFKLDPELSVEVFTALHYTGNRYIGLRYELGSEVDLDDKKQKTLEMAVRYDRETNIPEPVRRWMLVLAVKGSFKKK